MVTNCRTTSFDYHWFQNWLTNHFAVFCVKKKLLLVVKNNLFFQKQTFSELRLPGIILRLH